MTLAITRLDLSAADLRDAAAGTRTRVFLFGFEPVSSSPRRITVGNRTRPMEHTSIRGLGARGFASGDGGCFPSPKRRLRL